MLPLTVPTVKVSVLGTYDKALSVPKETLALVVDGENTG